MERSRPSPRPSSRDLTVGQTAQLVAEPLDAQGKVLSGRSVAWSSSRPNVATVSATDTITALSPGNTIITPNVEGKSGVGAITVAASPVVSVAVSQTSANSLSGRPSSSKPHHVTRPGDRSPVGR